MSAACSYLLTTEFQVKDGCLEQAADRWRQQQSSHHCLYFSEAKNSIVELKVVEKENISEVIPRDNDAALKALMSSLLRSDIKRELLTKKESVVDQQDVLPHSEYLQLRHIEVPLCVHEEYLTWREKTIFKFVKDMPCIDSFVAYHSVFSTLPGVMFVSGFSCDPANYLAGFSTETYINIIKQAGNRYIAGGEQGLYTSLYQRYHGE